MRVSPLFLSLALASTLSFAGDQSRDEQIRAAEAAGKSVANDTLSRDLMPTVVSDEPGRQVFEVNGKPVLLDHMAPAGANPDELERLKSLARDSDLKTLEQEGAAALQQQLRDPGLSGAAARAAFSDNRMTEGAVMGGDREAIVGASAQAISRADQGQIEGLETTCTTTVSATPGTPVEGSLTTQETCETVHYPGGCSLSRSLSVVADVQRAMSYSGTALQQPVSHTFAVQAPNGAVMLSAELNVQASGVAAEVAVAPSAENNWIGSLTVTPTCEPVGCESGDFTVTVDATVRSVKQSVSGGQCGQVGDAFCTTRHACTSTLPSMVDGVELTADQLGVFGPLFEGDIEACATADVIQDCPFNAGEVCWDGPSGRQCDSTGQGVGRTDTCGTLRSRPECVLADSRCAEGGQGESGWCYVMSHTYQCASGVTSADPSVSTRFSCNSEMIGLDGDLGTDVLGSEPRTTSATRTHAKLTAVNNAFSDWRIEDWAIREDQENPRFLHGGAFGKSAAAAPASDGAGTPLTPGLRAMGGTRMECRKALGGTIDCCTTTQSEANDIFWELHGEHSRQYAARQRISAAPDEQGSWTDMKTGAVTDDTLGAFTSQSESAQGGTSTEVGADASHAGIGKSQWPQDVDAAFTDRAREEIQPDVGWMCSQEEFDLAVKKEIGACVKLGSYCASDVAGVCLDKRDSYCCYATPASRIQRVSLAGGEQAVLDGALGSPKDSVCPGVPIDVAAGAALDEASVDELAGYMVKGGAIASTPEDYLARTSIDNLTGATAKFGQDDRKTATERTRDRTAQVDADATRAALVDDALGNAVTAPDEADGAPAVFFNQAIYTARAGSRVMLRVSRTGSVGSANARATVSNHENMPLAGLSIKGADMQWADGDLSDRFVVMDFPRSMRPLEPSRGGRFEIILTPGDGTRVHPVGEAWVEFAPGGAEDDDGGEFCDVAKDELDDPMERALFQPDGFEAVTLGWRGVMDAPYPNHAGGNTYPVGAWTYAGRRYSDEQTTRGRYLSIPINGDGASYQLFWIGATANTDIGYTPARGAASWTVTLSSCRGDFRMTSQTRARDPVRDPTLVAACRMHAGAERGLNYGPAHRGPDQCPVEKGKTYYLNIAFADPMGGFDPDETTCNSPDGLCEMSLSQRVTAYAPVEPPRASKRVHATSDIGGGVAEVTWEIELTNSTGRDAEAWSLADQLPVGHTFLRASLLGGDLADACADTQATPGSGSRRGAWICTGRGGLAQGATRTLRIVTSGPANVEATNTCSAELSLTGAETAHVTESVCRATAFTSAPPPVATCSIRSNDPLFQPPGLERVETSWSGLFGAGKTYPQDGGEPYPVGSWTIDRHSMRPGTDMRGRYISVPITGDGAINNFFWIAAKPVNSIGYAPRRGAEMAYMTISPCPGDFRYTTAQASPDPRADPTMRGACRRLAGGEAGIFYGPASRGAHLCPVERGQTYYLNIAFIDPRDGVASPTETTCSSGGACEVSLKHYFTEPPAADQCNIRSSHPMFQPSSYREYRKSWAEVFSGRGNPPQPVTFPYTPAHLQPVGSFSINDAAISRAYITVPITIPSDPNKVYSLTWYEAQVIRAAGYRMARPGAAYITLSPCAGDLRPADPASGDTWLAAGCRRYGQSSEISFTNTMMRSTGGACAVESGKTYYLNIAFLPYGSTSPVLGNGCYSGDQCEVNTSSFTYTVQPR